MSRYLQARADVYRVLLDCRAVQEVGEWQQKGSVHQEAAWRDQTLPLANLAAVLQGRSDAAAAHYVVLDTGNEALPRVMLLVENVSTLVDVAEDAFQRPMSGELGDATLYDAVHDEQANGILLRLDPAVLARTLLEQSSAH